MADTRYWSKEFLTEFIDIYRKHPALWMVKSKEYKSKYLKDKGHRELIELCRQILPNPDKKFVCKKIQSLRSCFRKELNKIEKSKRSGASQDDIYTPSLWYFNLLIFTRESETNSCSASNLSDDEDEECNVSDEAEETLATEETFKLEEVENKTHQDSSKPSGSRTNRFISKPQEKKFKSSKDEKSAFMKACTEALKKEDEFGIFGAYVGTKLKNMETNQRLHAENLINQILYKGQLKKLSENSVVIENNMS